jgi:hypothetical protein
MLHRLISAFVSPRRSALKRLAADVQNRSEVDTNGQSVPGVIVVTLDTPFSAEVLMLSATNYSPDEPVLCIVARHLGKIVFCQTSINCLFDTSRN